jgi:multiple sugar transport system permease protein
LNQRRALSRRRSGAWFAAPWLTGLLLLYLIPMAASAYLSLTQWDGLSLSTLKCVGWQNFKGLWTDRYFLKALGNSVSFTLLNVPVQVVVALLLAVAVRHSRRHTGLWATCYYLPHVFGGVAMILIWWWLLNPQVGPVNRAIRAAYGMLDGPSAAMGLGGSRGWPVPQWLYSPALAQPSLVIMNIWQAGGSMLILLAALLRDADALHDAARLDGAGAFCRFRCVTLPQISPAILFVALTGVIASMQAFNQPFLLRNFQQEDRLQFYSLQMYQTAFEQHRFGYATAMAWVLLGLLLLFSGGAVLLTRRWVHYDFDEGGA